MNLTDLWFGTDVVNRTGRKNIRGDELAALLAASGFFASPQVGKGAVVRGPNAQSIPPTVDQTITFNTVDYDDLGFFSATQPTRFTIPDVDPPINRVIFGGAHRFDSGGGGTRRMLNLRKNGNQQGNFIFPAGAFQLSANSTGTQGNRGSASSGPTEVVAGDIFALTAEHDGAGSININFPAMWIWVVS
ncbi:MAG: hypothetical protein GTN49_10870 [candidate division Zixibacteria bacterium]|nr:hypothetical protein [candidate division Zixibacteria bacterium]